MDTKEGGNPWRSMHSNVTWIDRVTVTDLKSSVTLFLRFPLESFPSWPTAAALVRRGLPGGSEEKENIMEPISI